MEKNSSSTQMEQHYSSSTQMEQHISQQSCWAGSRHGVMSVQVAACAGDDGRCALIAETRSTADVAAAALVSMGAKLSAIA
jgi:hypothetical protein